MDGSQFCFPGVLYLCVPRSIHITEYVLSKYLVTEKNLANFFLKKTFPDAM